MRELLKNKKITQIELAEQIGVSQQTISKWINKVIRPKYEELIKLSKILSISVEDLIKFFSNGN